jgi:hypothetical protein
MTASIKNDYLIYENIKPLNIQKPQAEIHHVTVYCYQGPWVYVCPNPRNKHKAEAAYKLYSDGYYTDRECIKLSHEQFANQANWRT